MQELKILLENCRTFEGASAEQLYMIADIMQSKSFNKGELLHKEGEARNAFMVMASGSVDISRSAVHQGHLVLITYSKGDSISEGLLVEDSFHTTTALCKTGVRLYQADSNKIRELLDKDTALKALIMENLLKQLLTKLNPAKVSAKADILQLASGKTRIEHDLLGERDVPEYAYFGIQTLRA
jgi:aspartate ammonia-lyase